MFPVLSLALVAGGIGTILGNRGLSRARPLAGRALLVSWAGLAAVAALLLAPYAGSSPATLAAAALAVAALAGGLLSDLREREVDIVPLFAGAAVMAAGALLGDGDPDALAGFVAGTGIALGIYAFGRVYARLRGIGLDPETGEQLDPLGAGDIALLALLGALAAPVAGVLVALPILLLAFVFHVVGTLVLTVVRRVRGIDASLADPVELAPFLVVATLVIFHA